MAKKKQTTKKMLAPIVTMGIIILLVALASAILAYFDVEGSQTSIVAGNLETSIVVVRNIFSKEGFIHFFSNIVTNFNIIQPFVILLFSLLAIGIAQASGLLKHLFSPLKRVNPKIITFLVIFISVISTMIGDYSYIILLPLVAVLYQYLGKSPVLGIITVFLGITLGYGTGIFYNYNDYVLGMLTQKAAIIDVDASYKYNLYSNLYIMLASTAAITYILTILVEKYLTKRVVTSEPYSDEYTTSRKALLFSLIPFLLSIIAIIIGLIPGLGGFLLDNTSEVMVGKIFSDLAPFNLSFMFLFLIVMGLTSLVYGFISKNFKNNLEFGWGFTKQFENIGYLLVLMVLSSILIGIVDWTNIGVVITNKLVGLLSVFDFTGIPLIIITFIFIIIMSLFLPGSVEKWILISPIVIPLFMRGNLTPDFAQFVFKAADSVGKILTPVFIFFPIMIGLIQKYNNKSNRITLFGTVKLIWPIVITMVIFWLLVLIIWYVAGLPLGIGALATM